MVQYTLSWEPPQRKSVLYHVQERQSKYTLRKKCYKEAEPPYPLSFWHFPVLFDAEYPAQFSATDCKMQSHFNLTFELRSPQLSIEYPGQAQQYQFKLPFPADVV